MSKNKIKIFMLLILLSTILFLGCVQQEKYPLKYYSEKDPESYLLLYQDGKYITADGSGKSIGGSYTIENDTIYIILPPTGTVFRFRKVDDYLIDEDGGKWIKTKGG